MSANIVKLSEYKEQGFKKRASFLIHGGVYSGALKSCEEFIAHNPGSTAGYEVRHEVHVKLEEYEKSLHDADKILRSGENERQGYFLKLLSLNLLLEKPRLALVSAHHLEKEKSYAQALEKTSAQALMKYKGDTQIDYLVAEGLKLLGKKEDAVGILEEHLKTKPGDVHCVYLLGLIYEETGEYGKALDCFEKGLKSIENYSTVFRESFSKLILESREQVLRELNEIENKNNDKNCACYDLGKSG